MLSLGLTHQCKVSMRKSFESGLLLMDTLLLYNCCNFTNVLPNKTRQVIFYLKSGHSLYKFQFIRVSQIYFSFDHFIRKKLQLVVKPEEVSDFKERPPQFQNHRFNGEATKNLKVPSNRKALTRYKQLFVAEMFINWLKEKY